MDLIQIEENKQVFKGVKNNFVNLSLKISELIKEVESVYGVYEYLKKDALNRENVIISFDNEIKLLTQAKEFLVEFAKFRREEIVNKIENVISWGLKTIFNKEYKFKLNFIDRMNYVEADFKVVSEVNNDILELDIMSAHGGGLVVIIAFLLRLMVILLSPVNFRKLMILDEPFVQLSKEYAENLNDLIKELSESLDIQFIIITHNEELLNIADKIYRFKNVKGITQIENLK